MKKSILTLATIASVLSFTSCKEVSAENTTGTGTEVIETTPPAQVEVLDTFDEEAIDSTEVTIEVEESATSVNE